MRYAAVALILLVFAAGCSAEAQIFKEDKSNNYALCPSGFSDDPYPGRCGMYTDSGKNGICDYSE